MFARPGFNTFAQREQHLERWFAVDFQSGIILKILQSAARHSAGFPIERSRIEAGFGQQLLQFQRIVSGDTKLVEFAQCSPVSLGGGLAEQSDASASIPPDLIAFNVELAEHHHGSRMAELDRSCEQTDGAVGVLGTA